MSMWAWWHIFWLVDIDHACANMRKQALEHAANRYEEEHEHNPIRHSPADYHNLAQLPSR